jgi:hypothetical protein
MRRLETGKFLGDHKRAFDADGLILSEAEYRRKVFAENADRSLVWGNRILVEIEK